MLFICLFYFLKNFLERGREGVREGEKVQCARETSIDCLWHAPSRGTWPSTQACALTGNWTSDLLVCSMTLIPLSHTSQSNNWCLLITWKKCTRVDVKWKKQGIQIYNAYAHSYGNISLSPEPEYANAWSFKPSQDLL